MALQRHSRCRRSQILTVLSDDPEASWVPSGEHATESTHDACPVIVPTCPASRVSKIFIVPSSQAYGMGIMDGSKSERVRNSAKPTATGWQERERRGHNEHSGPAPQRPSSSLPTCSSEVEAGVRVVSATSALVGGLLRGRALSAALGAAWFALRSLQ